jgi:hypothetical protein
MSSLPFLGVGPELQDWKFLICFRTHAGGFHPFSFHWKTSSLECYMIASSTTIYISLKALNVYSCTAISSLVRNVCTQTKEDASGNEVSEGYARERSAASARQKD